MTSKAFAGQNGFWQRREWCGPVFIVAKMRIVGSGRHLRFGVLVEQEHSQQDLGFYELRLDVLEFQLLPL